jgi:hypothetical protein
MPYFACGSFDVVDSRSGRLQHGKRLIDALCHFGIEALGVVLWYAADPHSVSGLSSRSV